MERILGAPDVRSACSHPIGAGSRVVEGRAGLADAADVLISFEEAKLGVGAAAERASLPVVVPAQADKPIKAARIRIERLTMVWSSNRFDHASTGP